MSLEVARNMRIRSADEILRIPVPDGLSGYELVNGELVGILPAGARHGRLAGEVYARIWLHLKTYRLGGRLYTDAGYVLALPTDPERMRGADVSYVSQENLDRHGGEPEQGFFHLIPDLAVEVESPQNPRSILKQRIRDYLAKDIRLIWVIHSVKRTATVYRAHGTTQSLTKEDVLDGEDVLPGLQIPLCELFED